MYVLYCDDDPDAAKELQEGFEFLAPEWEMKIADTLEKAETIVNATNQLDAVVTKSRVHHSDMDPLLLLTSDVHPGAIRILVDELVHTKEVFEPSSIAHQYMLAPVDHMALRDNLQRIRSLQLETTDINIQTIIGRIGKLPALPGLYIEIMEEVNSQNASIEKVADIVSKDVAMTTKILQLANSPVFGFTSRIMDVRHAVFVLGLDTIKGLVLSASLFSSIEISEKTGIDQKALIDHSIKVGILARSISLEEGKAIDFADIAYVGGFLHDVGRLVLASVLEEDYVRAHKLAVDAKMSLVDAETTVFGADHAKVGGCLLSLWGFPDQVCEAVFRHHEPIRSHDNQLTPLSAVHAASVIVDGHIGPGTDGRLAAFDEEYLTRIHCLDKISDWKNIATFS